LDNAQPSTSAAFHQFQQGQTSSFVPNIPAEVATAPQTSSFVPNIPAEVATAPENQQEPQVTTSSGELIDLLFDPDFMQMADGDPEIDISALADLVLK
jgi:hypothetical protein